MPDRLTVGAVWMRAVAGVVGYDGPLAKALGFAYTIARRRQAAYEQHEHGELLFAGLRFREVMRRGGDGIVVVCGKRFDSFDYDREVFGNFTDQRLHERIYCTALEQLEHVDVELLDTTDVAWRAYIRACTRTDLNARFQTAGKEISMR